MPSKQEKRASYLRGATLTYEVVGRFRGMGPVFAMPPKDIALIAPIDGDVGRKLARNGAATWLVAQLLEETAARKLPPPTVMMLRASLEMHDVPIIWARSLAELGIDGSLFPMGSGRN